VSTAFGPGQGEGHVHPIGLDAGVSVKGTHEEGGWYFVKTLWVSDASYSGPVLVRGGQLEGNHELRFEDGASPGLELDLPVDAGASSPGEEPGWREWPSFTRVEASGCYAFQVDGTGFTETVVFEVRP
jgi:hypothetical protein